MQKLHKAHVLAVCDPGAGEVMSRGLLSGFLASQPSLIGELQAKEERLRTVKIEI